MEDLGLFVEKKFIIKSSLPLEKVAESLSVANDSYSIAEAPKHAGSGYFAKISYRDSSRWVTADVRLEGHSDGLLFHVLIRYNDGRSERHLLNNIAKAIEDNIL